MPALQKLRRSLQVTTLPWLHRPKWLTSIGQWDRSYLPRSHQGPADGGRKSSLPDMRTAAKQRCLWRKACWDSIGAAWIEECLRGDTRAAREDCRFAWFWKDVLGYIFLGERATLGRLPASGRTKAWRNVPRKLPGVSGHSANPLLSFSTKSAFLFIPGKEAPSRTMRNWVSLVDKQKCI